jgi:hypothetical protein
VVSESADEGVGDDLAVQTGDSAVEHGQQHGENLGERVLPHDRPDRVDQRARAKHEHRAFQLRELRLGPFPVGRVEAEPDLGGRPVGELGLGDRGERLEHRAHRGVVDGHAVEGDRADQGVGRDGPVLGTGGDHRGVRNLRGRQPRCATRIVQEAIAEPVAEGAIGPGRHHGGNRLPSAAPRPGGGGLALPALGRVLPDRPQPILEQPHRPPGLPGVPGLTVGLLPVAGAAHHASHGLVAVDTNDPARGRQGPNAACRRECR